MLAISKPKGEFGAEIIETSVPEIGPKDVLARVKATSICGTDKHIYEWDAWAQKRIKPPMVFGHEFGGEVIEVGSEVQHIKVGDHVSGETHIPCGGCFQCKTGNMHLCKNLKILGVDTNGCFAEYVKLPEICCIRNSKEMPWEIASIQEPLGNAVYCISEGHVAGKKIAIMGDGPAGIFACAVAKPFGAMKVFAVGMQDYRLNLIKKFDVDDIVDIKKDNAVDYIMQKTNGEGVDVVVEMSGAEKAIHDGFKILKRTGTFVAFGIPGKPITFDFAEELVFKGAKIIAINGRKMFQTWFEVAALIESKRVDLTPVITHKFKLKDIHKAMDLLLAQDIKAGKIVLEA